MTIPNEVWFLLIVLIGIVVFFSSFLVLHKSVVAFIVIITTGGLLAVSGIALDDYHSKQQAEQRLQDENCIILGVVAELGTRNGTAGKRVYECKGNILYVK